ncbi:MAG: hypothetical protein LUH07_12680, partial [Lachnospiraceae bacterium]|nr:hypothetical protein [Lachnospiraceae bacterium]
ETVMVTGVSVGETYGVFRIGVGESADMSNLSGYFNFTIIVEEEQLPEIIADATTDSYTIGSDINAVIKCSGELSEFVSVAVDDVLVDASNYDLTEGSTIITFHKAYMDSLSVGEHKVTLTYTDGRTVSTSLVVYEAEKTTEAMEAETTMTESETVATESETTTTEAETKATESETESETDSSAVETGDNSPIAIYILVMVLAMTIMAAGAVERKVRRN